ncbi:MAG: hypothetical protein U5N55_10180 [Cypionkella sp.]|nr:hypothetical protein [Cypionkella sp.]
MQSNVTTVELLDHIHAAIMVADFDRLTSLTPALETSLADAGNIQDKWLLAQIKLRAERNAACLLAAGRGVRAAQRRLIELRAATQGFSTYNITGQRAQHGLPSSVARRF